LEPQARHRAESTKITLAHLGHSNAMNIITPIRRYDGESILEKIDLKPVRYFVAVAEAGGFRRAAERLDVPQSKLSRQIMRLEEALGHRLFVRRARHVELTDSGQILFQEARFITLNLDNLMERMNEARRGDTGSLCIGLTIAGSSYSIAARIIESLMRQKPQLSLSFCVASRQSLIEAVVERQVQACFAPPPAASSHEIRVDRLVTEPIVLAVHKDHRLAGRDSVDLAEIANEPVVLCERNWAPEIYDELTVACQKAGFSPRVTFHAPQEVCALLLASAGTAVTFVPASACPLRADNLHFASLSGADLTTSLALITRADEHIASVRLLRKRALAMAASATGGHRDLSARVHQT
jgi:DNA-binding transcriptional LysR family regulator